MPFCVACGDYEPTLYPHALCKQCLLLWQNGAISGRTLQDSNKHIERGLSLPMMTYLHDVGQFCFKATATTPHPIPQALDPGTFIPPGYSTYQMPGAMNRPYGMPPLTFPDLRRSSMAFIFMLLGLFLPIFAGIPVEILAIYLSLKARRLERPNWRAKVALVGSIVIVVMIICALILFALYPDQFDLESAALY